MESPYATPYMWIIVTYLISCTVSEILEIIGEIFGVDGVPVFNALVWREPLTSGLRNLASRTSFYCAVQSIFQHLEQCRRDSRVRRTERRTDRQTYIIIAYGALHNVARPKRVTDVICHDTYVTAVTVTASIHSQTNSLCHVG